jgi:hypothetical protein
VKIKILKDVGPFKEGEIRDAIKHTLLSYAYLYSDNTSLETIYEDQYELVKDEPEVKPLEIVEKFSNEQKNMIDLIRELSAVVSEIKFK